MKTPTPSNVADSGFMPASKSKIASTAIILALAVSCAHGAFIVQTQVNSEAAPTVLLPFAGDLLETSVTSVTGENAASLVRNGSFTDLPGQGTATFPAQVWGADPANAITTYGFDLSTNTFGYDITLVQAYSAWDPVRSGQSYRIFYAQVGAPTTFVQLGSDIQAPGATIGNSSVITRSFDDAGASILSNVSSIRFEQLNLQPAQNYPGGGTVYRELDVVGFASVPEPTTSMFGLGAALVLLYRRRR